MLRRPVSRFVGSPRALRCRLRASIGRHISLALKLRGLGPSGAPVRLAPCAGAPLVRRSRDLLRGLRRLRRVVCRALAQKDPGGRPGHELEVAVVQRRDLLVKGFFLFHALKIVFHLAHHEKDLLELRSVLRELYPEYLPFFEKCMARTYGHRFNMFIMRREVFNSYCQWLFDVLFETQKRLNTAGYDSYNMRVFGFLGERLIDCWLEKNQIDYVEMPVYFTEKQYWIKKIAAFLYRKYSHELRNGRGRF